MKVVTADEMRDIDRKTIEEYGVPGVVLMERAGLAVASRIKEIFGRKRVLVICGSGNNGGDGFVVARNLNKEGWDVKVFLTSMPENLKGDALIQYKTAAKSGVAISRVEELLTHHSSLITRHSIFVDALLGTGLSKNIAGTLSEIIRVVNNVNVPIVSIDIPSGISSDNGQIMGQAVRADYTITFGLPKRGHLLYPGAEYTGKLFIEDIGFPEELLRSDRLNVELLTKEEVSSLLPQRRRYSNKGDYGHVLIIAGSRGKTGAALMAAKACLRSGAGLVTIGVPESLADIFQSRVTEEMTLVLPDKVDGTLSEKAAGAILDFLKERADVVAIGPGIGVTAGIKRLMKTLIQHSTAPLVIDADGINSLQGEKGLFSKSKVPIILTPHPGEMARLLQRSAERTHQSAPPPIPHPRGGVKSTISELLNKIEQGRINTSLSFAKEAEIYLVLKGVPTVIASPAGRAYVNSTGNPGMATAGTGDVLTGMISGFLGQGLKALDASILGVYMHGLAGDIAATEKGSYSLIATDIIDNLPAAFHSLKNNAITI
jgi:ADP-dependent NAD(P)H-hydrate dehydratase / NAD(P)H-hydrate epimerase